MAYNTIEQLLDEIYAEATKKKYAKSISVKVEGPILKCRIYLDNSFINVFFNEETKTTAFTLIKGNKRIFGIDKDSLRGWHKHPIDKPNTHPPCQKTKFKQFLRQIEAIIKAK